MSGRMGVLMDAAFRVLWLDRRVRDVGDVPLLCVGGALRTISESMLVK